MSTCPAVTCGGTSPPPKCPARNGFRTCAPNTSKPAARNGGSDERHPAQCRFAAIGSDSREVGRRTRQRVSHGPQHPYLLTRKAENHMSIRNRRIGVGLISVGWMGQLHTRAYRSVPIVYPELGIKPELVVAADTAPDRVEFAREVLGYAGGTTDYREVVA